MKNKNTKKFKFSSYLAAALALFALTGCNGSSESGLSGGATAISSTPTMNAPAPVPRNYTTDALLFAGSGTWGVEVSSIENLLSSHGNSYRKVSSAELNAMSLEEITRYGVLIFPGGSGGTEAGSLTSATHARLREAVQKHGVSYVGFCAGAFIAQAPAPAEGQDVSYGLGIVNGPELDYYYLEYQGQDIAMTLHSFPDGSTRDILYYGGPVTPNIEGGVVAKYPNGDPAISQMWSGQGFVVIAGGHPTATESILSSLGVSSSDGVHTEYAWSLIDAALRQDPLPAF